MRKKDQATQVDALELRLAYDFASSGGPHEHNAFICLKTGKIYYQSDYTDEVGEEGLPDDLEASDDYVAMPHPKELGLGRALALDFAERALQEDCDKVAKLFSRRGAYARFKDFLEARGLLKEWYEFEEHATAAALQIWCDANGFKLVHKPLGEAH